MDEILKSQYLYQKTVLITGAAGFIGSHLVDKCLSLGARVIAVDNFITGRKVNLEHLAGQENFYFLEADVSTDPNLYLAPFLAELAKTEAEAGQIDLILHFASPASPPAYQAEPIATYLVNSLGTHNLLTYLHDHFPAARFVFASTSEVYGDPEIHPQSEDYWGNVNPNGERSCYDEAKRMGETICGVFERHFQLDVRILRIFNTYGPRMSPADGRILPNFINQALSQTPLTVYGDGQQTRSYCYVNDLVTGIIEMASRADLSGQTINLGNPDEYTVLETAVLVQKMVNGEVSKADIVFKDLPSDDPTRRKPDIAKAKELLSWEPQTDFRTGLEKTIEYFRAETGQN